MVHSLPLSKQIENFSCVTLVVLAVPVKCFSLGLAPFTSDIYFLQIILPAKNKVLVIVLYLPLLNIQSVAPEQIFAMR